MSCIQSVGFKKKLIAAAVLMIIITAAAFAIKSLSAEYLIMYDSDTGVRYITEKAEDGLMFSVEFVHSVNQTPVKDTYIIENNEIVGKIAIFHNRAEYRKLMEDLSGTRYLVDSMRANNHDFTNKLHVILGLIQMEMYEEAISYIQNITMVQRETISKVMNAVNEPAVAALIIGKIARASELNVKFVLREACYYSASDMKLPSEMMVTVIGNLLDNAFDAMNESKNPNEHNELLFGIYSRPGAVLITVDDTGKGIKKDEMEMIFMNGYSTKGNDRGTGLYQIKSMIENYGGKITVESQEGVGSSFSVSF